MHLRGGDLVQKTFLVLPIFLLKTSSYTTRIAFLTVLIKFRVGLCHLQVKRDCKVNKSSIQTLCYHHSCLRNSSYSYNHPTSLTGEWNSGLLTGRGTICRLATFENAAKTKLESSLDVQTRIQFGRLNRIQLTVQTRIQFGRPN